MNKMRGRAITFAALIASLVALSAIVNAPAQATAPSVGSSTPLVTGSAGPVTSHAVPRIPADSLSLVKSTTTTVVTAVGQVIPYTFLITNNGSDQPESIILEDYAGTTTQGVALATPSCPLGTLAPGASETCTSSYTVTAADMASPAVVDTAVATGAVCWCSTFSSNPSTVSIPVDPPASISVQKSTSTTAITGVGQQIQYSFLVTNRSNETLTNVTVVDTQGDPALAASLSPISCPSTVLAPGTSEICTATYTTTAADLSNGQASDSAVVTATPLGSSNGQTDPAISSAPSSVSVPYTPPATTPVPVPVAAPSTESPIVPTPVSVTG